MKINYSWLFATGLCGVLSASAVAQQASLTLNNSDAKICYTNNHNWTLTKTPAIQTVADGGVVNWQIQATKTNTGSTYAVHGALTITNTGTANATIGNIVINLQKPNNSKIGKTNVPWVSAAADCANSFAGDSALSANIVAAGSAEDPAFNAAFGAINYAVAGAKGTFSEGANSGSLSFTDVSDNSIWAIQPQQVLVPGQSVTLLYTANFSPALGAALAGKSVRVEALVTFGNCGPRGGSGASASNIDISGNGFLSADEANVRTVPSRITIPSPAVAEECNDTATVSDALPLTTNGTASYSNEAGFDQFGTVSVSTNWLVSVVAHGGTLGGRIFNTAVLDSAGDDPQNLLIGYGPKDPITGIAPPIYVTFNCCNAIHAEASAVAIVTSEDGGGGDGGGGGPQFHTYSQGGYQGGGVPGQIMTNYFAIVFPNGLTVGLVGSGSLHDATWSGNGIGLTAIQTFLGGGGPSGILTADTLNATSVSGGNLTKQMVALTLNVAFSNANVGGEEVGFGSLTYHNPGDALDGMTVSQILANTNGIIGGGAAMPIGYTFGSLNTLISNLNLSWDNGVQTAWAATHLS